MGIAGFSPRTARPAGSGIAQNGARVLSRGRNSKVVKIVEVEAVQVGPVLKSYIS
jgi:hypothetical protein